MMTKKTRALVAAGAGATVLLASGATFALWQATGEIDSAAIETGSLSVEVTQGEWRDISETGMQNGGANLGSAGTVIEISDFIPVPGDTLVGTFDVNASLVGTNLEAELSIPGMTTGQINSLITVAAVGLDDAEDGSNEVQVTIEFAPGNSYHLLYTNTPIPIGAGDILLTQVRD